MNESLKDQIDRILSEMEAGSMSIESCMKACEKEQPDLLDYIFQEEHDYLTEAEKDQLVFLFSILWNIRSGQKKANHVLLEDLEEQYWEERQQKDFPYSSEHPMIDAIDDEVMAVVIDCADEELNEISSVGSEWLLIKGLVIASVLTTS